MAVFVETWYNEYLQFGFLPFVNIFILQHQAISHCEQSRIKTSKYFYNAFGTYCFNHINYILVTTIFMYN